LRQFLYGNKTTAMHGYTTRDTAIESVQPVRTPNAFTVKTWPVLSGLHRNLCDATSAMKQGRLLNATNFAINPSETKQSAESYEGAERPPDFVVTITHGIIEPGTMARNSGWNRSTSLPEERPNLCGSLWDNTKAKCKPLRLRKVSYSAGSDR
jgi:hypothetical protein